MKVLAYLIALQQTYKPDDNIFLQIWDENEIINIAKSEELPLNENEAENIIARLEKRYDDSCFEADTTKADIRREIENYLREQ